MLGLRKKKKCWCHLPLKRDRRLPATLSTTASTLVFVHESVIYYTIPVVKYCLLLPLCPPPPTSSLSPSCCSFLYTLLFLRVLFFFRRKVQNVCCVGVAVVCFYNAFVGLGECLLCCVDILIWHCSKECRLVEIVFFFSFFLRLTRCNVESLFRNGYLTERPRSFLNFCAPTEFSAVWVYCKKQS